MPVLFVNKVNKLSSKCRLHYEKLDTGKISSANAAEITPFGGKAADAGTKMKEL